MGKVDSFYDQLWTEHLPQLERQEQFLCGIIGKERIKGRVVLDAGCGTGIAAIAFKKLEARRVVAIDLSERSLHTAKRLAQEAGVHLDLIRADIAHLPLKDNFEIIHSFGVLHHMPNAQEGFKSLARKLSSRGEFYLALYWKTNWTFLHQALRRVLRMFPQSTWRPIARIVARWMKGKKVAQRGFDGYGEIYDWLFVPYREHYHPEQVQKWFKQEGISSEIVIAQTGRYKSTSNFLIKGVKQ